MDISSRMTPVLFIFTLIVVSSSGSLQVCNKCGSHKAHNGTAICEDFKPAGVYVNGSCCLNKTSSGTVVIVGLDWSDCKLKTLPESVSSLTDLHIFHLDGNEDLTVADKDFTGLTNLKYLYLPSDIPCPGRNGSWGSDDLINRTVRVCQDELDLCQDRNYTCPNKNSHCVMTGPGQMDCLCNTGYHGYKCLQQGDFPTRTFVLGLCISTVVVAAFLWFTHRRKVAKKLHTN